MEIADYFLCYYLFWEAYAETVCKIYMADYIRIAVYIKQATPLTDVLKGYKEGCAKRKRMSSYLFTFCAVR